MRIKSRFNKLTSFFMLKIRVFNLKISILVVQAHRGNLAQRNLSSEQ